MNRPPAFSIPTPAAHHGATPAANGVRRPLTGPQRDALRGLARALRLALARVEEAADLNRADLACTACDSVGQLGHAAAETAAVILKSR